MTYHSTTIVGHAGRDAEMRYAPDGKAVTNFSVAVNEAYGGKKKTIWYNVTAWSKLAEVCSQYIKKGMMVLVEGRLSFDESTGGPRIWKTKDEQPRTSFELNASNVRFLSSKQEEPQAVVEDDFPF